MHLHRGLVSVCRLLRHRLENHLGERLGHVRIEGPRIGRRLLELFRDQRVCRARLERQAAGETLEQHHARRERSLRASSSMPESCSGDMYSGVPIDIPSLVNPSSFDWFASRAMPKSITLSTPLGSTTMFWGLMSRWITPCSCATSSARHSCLPIVRVTDTGSGPRVLMSCFRDVPSTYSIVR